jgi:putative sigma-54 modulation protein
MQVQIFNRHIKLDDSQLEYIRDKMFALKLYGEGIDDESTEVRVDIEANKIKTSNKNVTVQVTMIVPRAVIRAEIYSVTIEEGVDLAVEKLKRQIERYKGKKNRRDQSGKWIPASTLEEISSAQTGIDLPQIAKRKTFVATEPMHEDEAVEQLELLGHSFYAFLNADNKRFNVVYRRDDGTYGLLDLGSDKGSSQK